jgi:hypothetical protein
VPDQDRREVRKIVTIEPTEKFTEPAGEEFIEKRGQQMVVSAVIPPRPTEPPPPPPPASGAQQDSGE